jgi:DNA polymerase V
MSGSLRITAVFQASPGALLELPLYTCHVPAGFPSPADDHLDGTLDLNQRYVAHPAATFFVYTDGDSMKDAGIHSGDMLIVDRSIKPVHGKVVIACVDGELTVKRYCVRGRLPYLVADNPAFPDIKIGEGQEVTIWGVVLHSVHTL